MQKDVKRKFKVGELEEALQRTRCTRCRRFGHGAGWIGCPSFHEDSLVPPSHHICEEIETQSGVLGEGEPDDVFSALCSPQESVPEPINDASRNAEMLNDEMDVGSQVCLYVCMCSFS